MYSTIVPYRTIAIAYYNNDNNNHKTLRPRQIGRKRTRPSFFLHQIPIVSILTTINVNRNTFETKQKTFSFK